MADAWYLPFDGVNDEIVVPTPLTLSNDGDFLEIDLDSTDTNFTLFGDSGSGNFLGYQSTRWRCRVAGSGTVSEITTSAPSGRYLARFERVASGYELFINGSSIGTFSQPSGMSPDRFFNGILSGLAGDLYTARRNVLGSDVNFYKNNIDAVQTIFPDIIGGNDGTLNNFTSPPPWVLYDDGTGGTAVTADVTETSPAFADSISAALTKELSASITELAPSFADAIESTLTGNTEANITGLAPSFADLISATLTGAANAVEITELLPAFASAISATLTGNQSATVAEVAPSFSASITATTFPAGVTAASIIESAPSFTTAINVTIIGNTTAQISGLAPSFSDVVNASLSVRIEPRINELAPSFSASLTATVPSKWIDVVVPSATWTDKTTASATWINIR